MLSAGNYFDEEHLGASRRFDGSCGKPGECSLQARYAPIPGRMWELAILGAWVHEPRPDPLVQNITEPKTTMPIQRGAPSFPMNPTQRIGKPDLSSHPHIEDGSLS